MMMTMKRVLQIFWTPASPMPHCSFPFVVDALNTNIFMMMSSSLLLSILLLVLCLDFWVEVLGIILCPHRR